MTAYHEARHSMRTIKLTLSYDGTGYAGWQLQPKRKTIQQQLESAIASVTNEQVRVIASGRTDARVHALRQVASVNCRSQLAPRVLQRALNANLPFDIRILQVEDAVEGFHAIRDATGKRYRYHLQDGGELDVFTSRYAWHLRDEVDVDAMAEAAARLVGRHDFVSFQGAGSTRATTVRHVREFSVTRDLRDDVSRLIVEVEADGFLYNMVRILVGSLVEIGRGRQEVAWLEWVQQQHNRRLAGPTAPPQGLFLVNVDYPPETLLPPRVN